MAILQSLPFYSMRDAVVMQEMHVNHRTRLILEATETHDAMQEASSMVLHECLLTCSIACVRLKTQRILRLACLISNMQ